jgi:hypothetical protein
VPLLCLDGPTDKYGCITSRTKSARLRNTRNSWQHFEHLRTAMARTGRYEEEAPHKASVKANSLRVKRRIIRMRVNMTAATCSPAVAGLRAKYDDDFRVPTILGVQPLDAKYGEYFPLTNSLECSPYFSRTQHVKCLRLFRIPRSWQNDAPIYTVGTIFQMASFCS